MSEHQSGSGPWRPPIWTLGGLPKKHIDIPVTAVFLFLYILGAATHMTILQYNNRRGHKFLFNGMLFGFCMARITTCVVRIASLSRPSNIRLALAAQIFVAAGILLVFVVNLVWSQRILRAHHPLGWHRSIHWAFIALYVLIVLTLIIVITAVVQTFYTLNPHTRSIDRGLQLYGSTLFAVISFLPIVIIGIAVTLSYVTKQNVEKFGHGRHRTKLATLLIGATLCCLGASFRAGTSWMKPAPLARMEPEYFHRGWFYVMNFGIEITVVYFYAAMRVDLRFWIPNGAKGPGSYRVVEVVGEKEEGSLSETKSDV